MRGKFAVAATYKTHHPVGAGHAPPATIYIIINIMGWLVGAAYMPPVAAAAVMRYNG